jgi:hypothetical protein
VFPVSDAMLDVDVIRKECLKNGSYLPTPGNKVYDTEPV